MKKLLIIGLLSFAAFSLKGMTPNIHPDSETFINRGLRIYVSHLKEWSEYFLKENSETNDFGSTKEERLKYFACVYR